MFSHIAMIGGSSTLGSALIQRLIELDPNCTIYCFSRQQPKHQFPQCIYHIVDYDNEESLAAAATIASQDQPLDLVIVATGILHDQHVQPEKSLRDLSAQKFTYLFQVNTIVPALVAKHFLPKLNKTQKSVFAAFSARVGSISDNKMGGWYSYRASKAALNMVIKNASIEMSRGNPKAIVVGLHPGTVDSPLSQPFQKNIPAHKLFTADYAAAHLLDVLHELDQTDTGKLLAWDGEEVLP